MIMSFVKSSKPMDENTNVLPMSEDDHYFWRNRERAAEEARNRRNSKNGNR